jgi:hypothetical protein
LLKGQPQCELNQTGLVYIYTHLKKDSPFANTIMVTLANDRVGYIPDEANWDRMGNAAFVRGCAEKAIVDNLVDMMNATTRQTESWSADIPDKPTCHESPSPTISELHGRNGHLGPGIVRDLNFSNAFSHQIFPSHFR